MFSKSYFTDLPLIILPLFRFVLFWKPAKILHFPDVSFRRYTFPDCSFPDLSFSRFALFGCVILHTVLSPFYPFASLPVQNCQFQVVLLDLSCFGSFLFSFVISQTFSFNFYYARVRPFLHCPISHLSLFRFFLLRCVAFQIWCFRSFTLRSCL